MDSCYDDPSLPQALHAHRQARIFDMTSFVLDIALLGFDEFSTRQGLDARALLEEAGVMEGRTDLPLSGECFVALLELASHRSGNALFGLQLGLQQGLSALGTLHYVISSAHTVGDALQALIRYFPTHSNGAELRLEQRGNQAWLLYDVIDANVSVTRQTVELAMALGTRIMESLLGRAWKPQELLLRHAAGARLNTYRALLDITPRFDSTVNAWVFDHALLARALGERDAGLQVLLRNHYDDLANLTLSELPAHVQRLMRHGLCDRQTSLEQVAGQLALSPRTLQRYLQAEGTHFQALLDDTRQAMAKRYLCDSSINLTQLSEMLGYTSLGAFSRAFTRWHGVSPQKWRQLKRTGQLAALDAHEVSPP
ncbi:AraC family transcriptional regulator [Pseudomonas putida]|uniref:AraC family transcriptional regulator n=1 Tax=Pseudomonas putida TaxID=303 RepID=UPI0021632D8D|nr:AraC family transcriptional regulator [Pseudomonas putida]